MNQLLYERSTGNLSPQAFACLQSTRLLHNLQPSPLHHFDGGEREAVIEQRAPGPSSSAQEYEVQEQRVWAHQAGINALALEHFDRRLLLSGGADASIKLWDLDQSTTRKHTFKPTATIPRTASTHKFGITHLSWYPFDTAAFCSSSFDHHLKLYATETLALSADFDLSSIIYTHALSPIASHLLVACATQHPAVRLVDLRSGSSTHALAGHNGALLSVAWSPMVEHILASGGIDGTIRIWDIRKSNSALGLLDLEDPVGVTGYDGLGGGAHARKAAKAHQGPVNGTTWTDDGHYIVSTGHDARVRVWDAATGANTLASFGPTLRNNHLSCLPLLTSPTAYTPIGEELLFYPNERELLVFELHEGRLLRRLRASGPSVAAVRSRTGERNIKIRITAVVWRGPADGLYSSHTDGQIRAWVPRDQDDDILDEEENENAKPDDDAEGNKKKRKVLDDIFRDLTRQKISFG